MKDDTSPVSPNSPVDASPEDTEVDTSADASKTWPKLPSERELDEMSDEYSAHVDKLIESHRGDKPAVEKDRFRAVHDRFTLHEGCGGKCDKAKPCRACVDAGLADPSAGPVETALQLRAVGDLDGAIRLLYGALGNDFTNHQVVGVLASMLSENEQFGQADKLFERALNLREPDRMVLLNYGAYLGHRGKLRESVQALSRAAGQIARALAQSLHGGSFEGYTTGELYGQLGTAECNMARTYLELGEHDVTLSLAEKWMVVESTWEMASMVVSESLDRREVDEGAVLLAYHRGMMAPPTFVAQLADLRYRATGDVHTVLKIVAESARYLDWPWVAELDGFDEFMRRVSWDLRVGIMHGADPEGIGEALMWVGGQLDEDWSPASLVARGHALRGDAETLVHIPRGSSRHPVDVTTTCGLEVHPDFTTYTHRPVSCPTCAEYDRFKEDSGAESRANWDPATGSLMGPPELVVEEGLSEPTHDPKLEIDPDDPNYWSDARQERLVDDFGVDDLLGE